MELRAGFAGELRGRYLIDDFGLLCSERVGPRRRRTDCQQRR